jgi:hypothetical protein
MQTIKQRNKSPFPRHAFSACACVCACHSLWCRNRSVISSKKKKNHNPSATFQKRSAFAFPCALDSSSRVCFGRSSLFFCRSGIVIVARRRSARSENKKVKPWNGTTKKRWDEVRKKAGSAVTEHNEARSTRVLALEETGGGAKKSAESNFPLLSLCLTSQRLCVMLIFCSPLSVFCSLHRDLRLLFLSSSLLLSLSLSHSQFVVPFPPSIRCQSSSKTGSRKKIETCAWEPRWTR